MADPGSQTDPETSQNHLLAPLHVQTDFTTMSDPATAAASVQTFVPDEEKKAETSNLNSNGAVTPETQNGEGEETGETGETHSNNLNSSNNIADNANINVANNQIEPGAKLMEEVPSRMSVSIPAATSTQVENVDSTAAAAAPPSVPVLQTPQTSLTFLLVSGKRRTMSFEPQTTVGRVKELVWNAWPNGIFMIFERKYYCSITTTLFSIRMAG